ncbi:hypothetical protein [Flammeovirga kamogawensis]|uniref:Uncharacterized protein n=1 Tax=Flammeovirga kamogawensis TaxID=373891 RepID=A0ABX8GZN8_9BACT|nr:hypothetical protein [Flammeovirga kamogawensis]MBB6459325.1 hypothetical protein [Flammeovirga kamogawensis]QWG08884.1 hypothetical protein KM029_08060 [Flammeovirga kamogawensis]TRX67174.1 hypothetical protein EO216_03105 [Flammeovirga kamogawensis]
MKRYFYITFLLIFSLSVVNAQAYLMTPTSSLQSLDNTTQTTPKQQHSAETSSSPAFLKMPNTVEVEGAPTQLVDYINDFTTALNKKNYTKVSYYFIGAEKFSDDTKALKSFIDKYWCGKEEGKEYNGITCLKTDDIKKIEVVSSKQLGGTTYVLKHRLTTKKEKKVMVELVMQLSEQRPQFVGAL